MGTSLKSIIVPSYRLQCKDQGLLVLSPPKNFLRICKYMQVSYASPFLMLYIIFIVIINDWVGINIPLTGRCGLSSRLTPRIDAYYLLNTECQQLKYRHSS